MHCAHRHRGTTYALRPTEVRMQTSLRMLTGCVLICLATSAVVAHAQSSQSAQTTDSTLQGTVISTASATLVVKTSEGLYQLFVLDRDTVRPKTIPAQAQVKVSFMPSN